MPDVCHAGFDALRTTIEISNIWSERKSKTERLINRGRDLFFFETIGLRNLKI